MPDVPSMTGYFCLLSTVCVGTATIARCQHYDFAISLVVAAAITAGHKRWVLVLVEGTSLFQHVRIHMIAIWGAGIVDIADALRGCTVV